MRERERAVGLGRARIENVKIRTKSRDDIPAMLVGLQEIYVNKATRAGLVGLLETKVAPLVGQNKDRPGMDPWPILVLGVLKTGLDCDWGHLEMLANEMKSVRAMMGLREQEDEDMEFERQTLIDNVGVLTPEMLREVNELVVETGHKVVRTKPWRAIARSH